MKATHHMLSHSARAIMGGAFAMLAIPFTAHSALTPQNARASAPAALEKGGTERHGQVKFSSGKEQIVGEIVIRHDAENLVAQITKGPGLPLLTLTAKFGSDPKAKGGLEEKHMLAVHASGPLAHGGWTWRPRDLTKKNFKPEKLKDSSRAWAALPEVFMWGDAQAKGESFRVTLPDIIMHARAGEGEVARFDYVRHQNPTGEALPLRDLKKQPALESVICHLD